MKPPGNPKRGLPQPAARPVTRERIERALDVLAGIIASGGPADAAALAPIYDRLERELAAFDKGAEVQARARTRADGVRLAAADYMPRTIADLPMFAPDEAIAAVFMGRGKTAEWRQIAALLEGRGLPKIDALMGGRYVPAVKRFFDDEYKLSSGPPLAARDGTEDLGSCKKRKTNV